MWTCARWACRRPRRRRACCPHRREPRWFVPRIGAVFALRIWCSWCGHFGRAENRRQAPIWRCAGSASCRARPSNGLRRTISGECWCQDDDQERPAILVSRRQLLLDRVSSILDRIWAELEGSEAMGISARAHGPDRFRWPLHTLCCSPSIRGMGHLARDSLRLTKRSESLARS